MEQQKSNSSKKLKNFFLPTKENDFYPYSLRKKAIISYVLIAILIKAIPLLIIYYVPTTDFFAEVNSNAILSLTNEFRRQNGLNELKVNPLLNEIAKEKASDMINKKYFAHNSPDGLTPWYWFIKNNYNYKYAGENLAIDFIDSSQVIEAWLNSPSHRANLLNQNYQEIGVAVVSGDLEGYETTLVVQVFGTPKETPIPQPVEVIYPQAALINPTLEISPRVIAQEETNTSSGSLIPSPIETTNNKSIEETSITPELTPSIVVSISPSSSPLLTSPTSALPVAFSSDDSFISSLNPQNVLISNPNIFNSIWNLIVNSQNLLIIFLIYLIITLVLGIFSKSYAPPVKVVSGILIAITITLLMIYLPNAPEILGFNLEIF